MSDLIERYVHEVGRYLPKDERDEVQNELRSLIQDQLDDRTKGSPADEDVIELLTELGEPRKMAASYGREQYLIGPDLYPAMMYVLQRGWVLVPAIAALVNVLVAGLSGDEMSLWGLFLDTAALVVQAVFTFTGIVVLLFAIFQHTGVELEQTGRPFNPLELPRVDDPATVDRAELGFNVAFSIFGVLLLTYFFLVGGLTLTFNLSDPGTVLPVPRTWLAIDIAASVGLILIALLALRRGRWSAGLLLSEAGLEVITTVASYFVFIKPLFGLLFESVPALANLPFAANAPLITTVLIGILTLGDTFGKLFKVLFGGRRDWPSITVGENGDGQPRPTR